MMGEKQMIESEEMEIDLSELFHVLLKKWWMILLAALLGVAIMAGYTKFLVTPVYESQAMLYVVSNSKETTSVSDLQIGTALTRDFEIIATSKAVLDASVEKVAASEDIELTRVEIKNMITISSEEDTRILFIKAVGEDPKIACAVANAVSQALAERVAEITNATPPSVVSEAEVPTQPATPSLIRNAMMGFLIGAVLVSAVLIIQHLMNDSIKTKDDITRELGVPTLAMIPYVKNKENKKEELKSQSGRSKNKKKK